MKVLFDHQTFEMQRYGGISKYFHELATGLAAEQVDYILPIRYSNNAYLKQSQVLLPMEAQKATWFERIVRKRFQSNKNEFWSIENKRQVFRALEVESYDIYHPTYYDDFLLSANKNPLVITIHDLTPEIYPEYFPLHAVLVNQKKIMIKKADHIIAVSANTKRDIIDFYDVQPDKISVIYHGYRHENLSVPEQQIQNIPNKYVLYVGQRMGYKNFYFTMSALANLLLSDKDLHIVVVGGKTWTEEQSFLEQLGIKNQVLFLQADDALLSHLYSHALVFIFPSLYEGFGIPILEAFANSCPVCLSDASCFPEVAGNAAVYFNPKSKNDIHNAVSKLVNSTELRNEYIERGSVRLLDYTWEKAVRSTVDVYKSLI